MKKSHLLLYFILFLSFNSVKSQDFYTINDTIYNKAQLKIYLNKFSKLIKTTNRKNLKLYFRTNQINILGDSCINLRTVTMVPKNFQPGKIFNLINKPLPYFALEKYNGNTISIEQLAAKPTIINLWNTKCAPCLEEIPILNSIKYRYKDKLNYLAITYNDRATVNTFLQTHTFDFDIIINAQKYLSALGNNSYPRILLIDKNYTVKFVDFALPLTNNIDEVKLQKEFYKTIDALLHE